MSEEYPNTGALWRTKEKKHPKAPDMWGRVELDKHYLLSLIEESTGNLIEVKLDAWTKESANGKFLSLKVNTWKPEQRRTVDEQKAAGEDDENIPF